jgi:hypothetical protein
MVGKKVLEDFTKNEVVITSCVKSYQIMTKFDSGINAILRTINEKKTPYTGVLVLPIGCFFFDSLVDHYFDYHQ